MSSATSGQSIIQRKSQILFYGAAVSENRFRGHRTIPTSKPDDIIANSIKLLILAFSPHIELAITFLGTTTITTTGFPTTLNYTDDVPSKSRLPLL